MENAEADLYFLEGGGFSKNFKKFSFFSLTKLIFSSTLRTLADRIFTKLFASQASF